MIKQIKTTWRPLLRLTELAADKDGNITETGNEFHLNVLDVPHIISNPNWTALIYDHHTILVKESAKDIYKAVDKMVEEEQERKAKQAEEYMKATQARVAETAKNVVSFPNNDNGENA
jgi:uncharacterized protein YlzI (FlbEa/FlbD family)